MSELEHEAEDFTYVFPEKCCFCKQPTRYWFVPQNVAVCLACAKLQKPEGVLTKEKWLNSQKPNTQVA